MGLRLRRYLRTAVITAVLAACLPGAVSGAAADGEITTKEQLNRPGMRVGVSTGSGSVLIVEKELPEAEKVYYDDTAAAYEAVAQGVEMHAWRARVTAEGVRLQGEMPVLKAPCRGV